MQYFIYAQGLRNEYPDCPHATVIIYSYMLCRYAEISSQGGDYTETQHNIAEHCKVAIASTKLAVKWLHQNGFIGIGKKHGASNLRNCYTVYDRYSIYSSGVSLEYSVKHRPCNVYLVEITTEHGDMFLKAGISIDIDSRIKGCYVKDFKGYRLLYSKSFESTTLAIAAETVIHRTASAYSLPQSMMQAIMDNGTTECYHYGFKDKVLDIVKQVCEQS